MGITDFERDRYEPINVGQDGYHEQNVCQTCKYYLMRWRDNICKLHNRRINAIGICDKFIRNK